MSLAARAPSRTADIGVDGEAGRAASPRGSPKRPTTPASVRAAGPARPAGPSGPPGPPSPPGARRAPGDAATALRPRPRATAPAHRPPTKAARRSTARPQESWAGGRFHRRVRLVRFVLIVAMLLLVARLVDVQVLHAGAYEAAARGESSISVSLPSLRGGIYARDGSPLAMSVPTDDVVADDFQVAHPVQTALALSPLLGVPATTLATQLHERSGYVVLARQLSQTTGQKIAADAIPGITLIDDSKRLVPNGNLAAPVVGFTNAAGQGAAGLEYGDNRQLAGTAGKETIMESPAGVALPQSPVTNQVSTTPGTGLELTLDTQLQYESEQALAEAIESSNAVSGTAVVMDVKTGQILSMANLAATHPDASGTTARTGTTASSGRGVIPIGPHDAVDEAQSNLAVTQLYEPGSVFKLVTFSAALQDGLINPNTVFTVPDQIQLDGSTFHDAEPHPDRVADRDADPGAVLEHRDLGDRAGRRRAAAARTRSRRSGFGQPTGLDFPGESPGLLATAAQWEPTDYVSLPIGQVDAVSALQVLDAYNAVANGGVFVAPKLVQATVSPSGALTQTAPSATHEVFSPSVDAELTSMLEQVVNTGTGTSAAVPGYTVAGQDRDGPDPHPGP